jgi:hypothetical protein
MKFSYGSIGDFSNDSVSDKSPRNDKKIDPENNATTTQTEYSVNEFLMRTIYKISGSGSGSGSQYTVKKSGANTYKRLQILTIDYKRLLPDYFIPQLLRLQNG